ncbi:hypothetical protein Tco_1469191, partial [Tanacetum coccineum]
AAVRSIHGLSAKYRSFLLDQSMGYLPPVNEASSSQEQHFLLHPLFTMKRLDRYILGPNEEFLAQLAKSHHEEGNLIDIIDPEWICNHSTSSQKQHIVA